MNIVCQEAVQQEKWNSSGSYHLDQRQREEQVMHQ